MPTAREHLDRIRDILDGNAAATRRIADGLSDAQLLWRPAADAWGVADCLEHLIATGTAYYPRARTALQASPAASADGVYRDGWFGRWFVRGAGPHGRRIRTFGQFAPPPARPDAPARFVAQQAVLRALVEDARGRDLAAARVTSPVTRLLRLRLGEALEMLAVHEARHIRQAERVRAAPGFPAT